MSPLSDFANLPNAKVAQTDDGMLIHIDRGSNVLAVAHLDTVQQDRHFIVANSGWGRIVFSAQLDDRLGVYLLLDYLPKWGILPDILLTEGEEVGRSTAGHFWTDKDYNWIFSFDRRGTDIVMYDYESPEWSSELERYGLMLGQGSFSDICWLSHLGIVGFNFGCGYQMEHSHYSFAILRDTFQQVKKFAKFYRDYAPVRLEYAPYYDDWRYKRQLWYNALQPDDEIDEAYFTQLAEDSDEMPA